MTDLAVNNSDVDLSIMTPSPPWSSHKENGSTNDASATTTFTPTVEFPYDNENCCDVDVDGAKFDATLDWLSTSEGADD